MSTRILIDAVHPEETRVAVIDAKNRLVEYDFTSSTKQTLKGNIYLAKVARVEPSLQAAFVDFGGNRHGFLAFSEIHPDYFRIPISDREKLKAEMITDLLQHEQEQAGDLENPSNEILDTSPRESLTPKEEEANPRNIDPLVYPMVVSALGGETPIAGEDDDLPLVRRPSLHKRYKIQEVIHKNQVLLIQVAKEERSGKGAAVTTYLSLAGRYCVLMPNSPKSGGISRKISHLQDRKRLKEILDSLGIPEGMGLIIRTAGKERTKAELRRDTEYLMRLWNNIRELTLKSTAPTLIYAEDDIIKRAIRDLYGKEVKEILIEGTEGIKVAMSFMKHLMPTHVKKIIPYTNLHEPLFLKEKIENQINQMYQPIVHLPSGGYIVIHPTEALVSIDINSGKANRNRHIEETATQTNLEAAEEISRQLRLRDLAGLVAIDFIDMDQPRNIAAVEKRMRESLKTDRARLQVGKISPLGLMELSRQRLRPSILETSSLPCPHCQGTGYIRSVESVSLNIIRALQEECITHHVPEITAKIHPTIGLYILNEKRKYLLALEERHQIRIVFETDQTLTLEAFSFHHQRSVGVPEGESSKKEMAQAFLMSSKEPHHPWRKKAHSSSDRREGSRRSDQETTLDKTETTHGFIEGVESSSEDATLGSMEKKSSHRRRKRHKRGEKRPSPFNSDPALLPTQTSSEHIDQKAVSHLNETGPNFPMSPDSQKPEAQAVSSSASELFTSAGGTEQKAKRRRHRARKHKMSHDHPEEKRDTPQTQDAVPGDRPNLKEYLQNSLTDQSQDRARKAGAQKESERPLQNKSLLQLQKPKHKDGKQQNSQRSSENSKALEEGSPLQKASNLTSQDIPEKPKPEKKKQKVGGGSY